MDTQDGQDINLYHVYPVHPCELKKNFDLGYYLI